MGMGGIEGSVGPAVRSWANLVGSAKGAGSGDGADAAAAKGRLSGGSREPAGAASAAAARLPIIADNADADGDPFCDLLRANAQEALENAYDGQRGTGRPQLHGVEWIG